MLACCWLWYLFSVPSTIYRPYISVHPHKTWQAFYFHPEARKDRTIGTTSSVIKHFHIRPFCSSRLQVLADFGAARCIAVKKDLGVLFLNHWKFDWFHCDSFLLFSEKLQDAGLAIASYFLTNFHENLNFANILLIFEIPTPIPGRQVHVQPGFGHSKHQRVGHHAEERGRAGVCRVEGGPDCGQFECGTKVLPAVQVSNIFKIS